MQFRPHLAHLLQGLALALLVAALLLMQTLVGGTRMAFSLPAYMIVGTLGSLAVFLLRTPKPLPNRASLIAVVLCFGYLLLRAAFSPVPFIARSDIFSMLAALVIYLSVALLLTSARQRMFVLGCLLLFALVQVFVGAVQFRDGNNFMPISWLQRYDYGTRASGLYVCPNHFAGLLEALGVMGLSLVVWSRWPVWAKLLLGWVVGCCYVGVIISGSRGGYLSAAASLGVFAFLSLLVLRHTEKYLFWRIGGLAALAALLVGGLVFFAISKNQFLTSRAQAIVDPGNMRLDLWHAALRQWRLQPLLGTGSGTYLYFGRLFRTEAVQRDPIYSHNDYVHLLAEYGLVGAAGMALVLFLHLRNGARSFVKLGPRRIAVSQQIPSNGLALNLGALAALSAYLVHSALDFNLHIPANALFMAVVFGILANDGVARPRDLVAVTTGGVRWRIAVAVLGLFLLVQSARLFPGEYFSERARAALRDNQPATAMLYARRGLPYDPQNPDLHFWLGLARVQFGDRMGDPRAASSFYDDAIGSLQKARGITPQEEIYALELASTLDAARRFTEAEWLYYEALQLDPRSQSLRRSYDGHLQSWEKAFAPENLPKSDHS